MTSPEVCVLLPIHNAEAHLPEALESLCSQTFPDWSALLLDDGSSDASAEIASDYAAKDGRFRVVRLPRRGLVATLNDGLRLCDAPLVARMDADDVSLPERLEKQVAWMRRHPRADVLATRVAAHPSPEAGEGMALYIEWSNGLLSHAAMAREIFVESPLVHPTAFIRRDTLEAAGGWRDRGWPEDYDLWLRLWRDGRRFAKLPESLLLWRDTAGRLSRREDAYSLVNFRRCRLHHLGRSVLKDRREITLWGAGREGRWWLRELTVTGLSVRRMVDIDPEKVRRGVGDVPVVPPEALHRRLPGDFILVAVASRGARPSIRERLSEMNYEEARDYIFIA